MWHRARTCRARAFATYVIMLATLRADEMEREMTVLLYSSKFKLPQRGLPPRHIDYRHIDYP